MIEVTQLSKTYPLVCRRLVVPDQRATSGADRHCQSVATHSRAGVDALRLWDRRGAGLRDIWGMANTTVMATLSTAVGLAYAVLFLALALRVFRRAAVR